MPTLKPSSSVTRVPRPRSSWPSRAANASPCTSPNPAAIPASPPGTSGRIACTPSLADLITTVGELRHRDIGFTSLHENLDTTTPGGRLVFHVFAALAEFIRELIVSGTREGLVAARARGRVGGRPTVITPEILRAARDMLPNPDASVTAIAKLLGVSPGTLYIHIPDLRELRAAGRARTPLPSARPASQ
jgi:hypothetical protein